MKASLACALAPVASLLLFGCESSPPPKPSPSEVKVLSGDAIVEVDSERSKVYVGEEGIKIKARGTNVDIGGNGINILTD
jgi:hypothetical protein